MIINSNTGEVAWSNPTLAGSPHVITIRATNSAGSDDESWSLTVSTGPDKAKITSPASGSTLTSSSVTFTWSSGTGVSEYWLYVGSTPGSYDIYNKSQGTNLSTTITGLPTDGRTLYVTLFSAFGGGWPFNPYTYTTAP